MNLKANLNPKTGEHANGIKPSFNIVIVYDGRNAASRAMDVFSRLVSQFGDDFDFRCDLWRFDVLGLPEVRGEAARAGDAADLLIVSASGNTDLPTPVQDWLKWCVDGKPPGSAALVGLLESCARLDDVQCHTRQFLKDEAERSHLDFFLQEVDLPHLNREPKRALREKQISPVSAALPGVKSRGKPAPRPQV